MIARIYSPAKTPMQSGKRNTGFWILQYEPVQTKMIEPLMGYTATADINSQIKIRFKTKEEAIAFAVKNAIPYRVENLHKPLQRAISYSDNFHNSRQQPWTH
ncbi:NADH-ubiquinone oxidoreductase [Bartonella clarridgeiae 73]|uniref:NADH-ubiquinone oxidoreductase n=1 Tax=Bartonella clarridgeiae (strain CCUG 45776 / CIP 104772 / 73) TaxID=696125 RepID=E6YHP8_BARC7|nr:ETC complex I subunit [Bartonella clarridgeiae]WCR55038.1 MAG: NADH-ubiquinone oxidoreductase [Bartonella clarridgeiae]CBI76386.1 NADH-ubiquinone oxidoreductase [Bartonella clarridgeiae 73]